MKEKLPQKAQEKLVSLKNKTSTLSQELRVKAKMPSSVGDLEKKFFEQLEVIKKNIKDLSDAVSEIVFKEKMSFQKFVYGAGIYNLALAVCMGLPEGVINLGLNIGYHALSELIAGFLLFTAVIQIIGSRNVPLFDWAIYWEGILRLISGFLLTIYGFFGLLGIAAGILGLIDLVIGVIYLMQLPKITKKPPLQLLTGK